MADKEQTERRALKDAHEYEDHYGDFAGPPEGLDEDAPPISVPRTGPDAASGDSEPLEPNTETVLLLNKLIAECHFAMCKVSIPTAMGTTDDLTRQRFLGDTMDLAKAGATVGKTVAMLRASGRLMVGGLKEKTTRILPAIDKNG